MRDAGFARFNPRPTFTPAAAPADVPFVQARVEFQPTADFHAGRRAEHQRGRHRVHGFNPRPTFTPAAARSITSSTSTVPSFQPTADFHAGRRPRGLAPAVLISTFQPTADFHAGRRLAGWARLARRIGFNPRPTFTPAAAEALWHVWVGDRVSTHGRLSRRPPRRLRVMHAGLIKFQPTADFHAGRRATSPLQTRRHSVFQPTADFHAGRRRFAFRRLVLDGYVFQPTADFHAGRRRGHAPAGRAQRHVSTHGRLSRRPPRGCSLTTCLNPCVSTHGRLSRRPPPSAGPRS